MNSRIKFTCLWSNLIILASRKHYCHVGCKDYPPPAPPTLHTPTLWHSCSSAPSLLHHISFACSILHTAGVPHVQLWPAATFPAGVRRCASASSVVTAQIMPRREGRGMCTACEECHWNHFSNGRREAHVLPGVQQYREGNARLFFSSQTVDCCGFQRRRVKECLECFNLTLNSVAS